MKKYLTCLSPLVLALFLYSCSSSDSGFESDVRKMAQYRCQMEKLTSKGNLENMSAELDKLQKEVQEFAEKMEKKYDEKKMSASEKEEMEEKAEKIMKEEMEKCK